MVDEVLTQSKQTLDDVNGFTITTGPGSFTGLRVGVSLIKGFVIATGKPYMSVDTLEAVTSMVEPTPYPICPVLDARKKELYTAFFKYEKNELKRKSPDRAVSPSALCEMIQEPTVFLGNGLDTYGKFLSSHLGSLFVQNVALKKHSMAAGSAFLAYPQFDSNKSFNLNALKINYVRKSEAEIKFGR